MKKTHKFFTVLTAFFLLSGTALSASSFFTGYAGGILSYSANNEMEEYDPALCLSAFFSGQFNFSDNLWSHLEFSVKTEDLLDQSLFSATAATFQIDEISVIKRKPILQGTNYFSAYMGSYDPIGSDIFLQRYFGIEPIGTKLADNYLGIAGSILYPHFGIGISDIVRLTESPIAYGGYFYLNNENSQYYILNADFRFATSLRYFTADFSAGLGAPLYDTYKGESTFLVISKLYFHAGTTILIGNNYTNSLFIQAGLFNTSYEKGKSWNIEKDSIYLLFEPRFRTKNSHINLSVYALPQSTVDKFLFVDDTLGVDLNIYSDTIPVSAKMMTMGVHVGYGLPGKSLMSFKKESETNGEDNINNLIAAFSDPTQFDINITPYIATQILKGEANALVKLRIMDFITKNWYNALSAEVGYNLQF